MQTTSDPLIGQRLAGKYEITDVLGHGGFGTVYTATQHSVGRRVAVKLIRPEHISNGDVRQRFLREAHAVAALSHPSVVTLFDYGVEPGGQVYMVLEYIDGEELYRVMQREAPMEPERVIALGRQALAGLAEAHRLRLVHRDLKPANMMVVTDSIGQEQLKILDFGIAKLVGDQGDFKTKDGIALGTPTYMSPEQALARGIGPWSDQYALGVVLYEMLAGCPPFFADSEVELLNRHIAADLPAFPAELEIPSGLEAVIRRALAKAPDDRFPDVIAMAHALAHSLVAPAGSSSLPVGRRGSTKRLAAQTDGPPAIDGHMLLPTAAMGARDEACQEDLATGTPPVAVALPSAEHAAVATAADRLGLRWLQGLGLVALAAVAIFVFGPIPADERSTSVAVAVPGALTPVADIGREESPGDLGGIPAVGPQGLAPFDAELPDSSLPDTSVDAACPVRRPKAGGRTGTAGLSPTRPTPGRRTPEPKRATLKDAAPPLEPIF